MSRAPLPISLCMIVRDGAEDLQACLACVAGWFAQMVVVDTGSVDQTAAVARAAGAAVYDFAWCDDFSAARNAALAYATHPWILVLDADERLDADAYDHLAACLRTDADAFVVPYRSYTNHTSGGDWIPNDGVAPEGHGWSGWVPGRVVRLFRNGRGYQFAGRVHETVDQSLHAADGAIADAPFCIHHLQERHGWEHVAAKQRRYLQLMEQEIAEGRATAEHLTNVGIIRREFCDAAAEAVAPLRQALDLAPAHQPAWRELMATYLTLGRHAEAKHLGGQMAARWPDDPLPHYALGMVCHQAGDLPAAEAAFQAALRLAPMHVHARLQLAGVQLKLGKHQEARPLLEGLHRAYPAHMGILRQLSAAYACLRLNGEAAATLERAAAAVPPDAVLWNNLGVIRAQAGDRTGAAAAFRQVLALEPSHADARRNLAALEHTG